MNQSRKPSANASQTPAESFVPEWRDPVVEAYKKDVDRTLLRENLKLSVEERFEKFRQFAKFAMELRDAGHLARTKG